MTAGNESVGHTTGLQCCLLPDLRSYHNIFLPEISNTRKIYYLILPFRGNIWLQLPSSSCHGALPLLFFPSAVPLLWCKCPNPVTLVISDFYRIQHSNSNFSLVLHSLTSQELPNDFTHYLVNLFTPKVVFWNETVVGLFCFFLIFSALQNISIQILSEWWWFAKEK